MSNTHDALLERLKSIKAKYGEAAYQDAARDVARSMIAQGGDVEKQARSIFGDGLDVGLDSPADGPADPLTNMIRQTMPHLRTQAQFNAFMATFEALRASMDAVFQGTPGATEAGAAAIKKGLEAAVKATEISGKLRDVPEAAMDEAAEVFKTPPKEFNETTVQRALLAELQELHTSEGLKEWYAASRARMDRIAAQSLRNELFDAIREKRHTLA